MDNNKTPKPDAKSEKALLRKTLIDENGMTYEVEQELDMSIIKLPNSKDEFEVLLRNKE